MIEVLTTAWPYVTLIAIIVCFTIAGVLTKKYESEKDKIIVFHCPDCQKYYPHEDWGDFPTARIKSK